MTRRLIALLVVAGSVLIPSLAGAQLYTVQRATGAAPIRTGWTDITFLAGATALPGDVGAAKITLPFSFSFYGIAYSEITVTPDGVVLFDNDANNIFPNNPAGSRGCGNVFEGRCANVGLIRIPDSAPPNNLIAFWWSDMMFAAATGDARWTVSGTSPNRILSVQYTNWMVYDAPSGKSPRTVQMELFETTNEIRVYYGALSSNGDPGSGATVGLESKLVGSNLEGVQGLACSGRVPGGTATAPYRCRTSDWPSGEYLSFMPTALPDLRVDSVVVTAISTTTVGGNPGLQVTVDVTVSNHGQDSASGVAFDLYTTTTPTTPLQTLLGRSSPTFPVGLTPVTRSITVQFARPAAGTIYFAAKVDPDGVVAEVDETNNNSALSTPIGLGTDLVATSISTTLTSGHFGMSAPISFVITNAGIDPTVATFAELWLSTTISARNPGTSAQLATVPVPALAAAQVYSMQVTYPLRGMATFLPAGTYYVQLVLDPSNRIPELSDANNVVASAGIRLDYAEFQASGLSITGTATPYQELSEIHFGDTIRLAFRVANNGVAASGIDVAAMITTGSSIKPLLTITNFALICTPANALETLSFAANASRLIEVTCVVPTTNNASPPQPLPSSPGVRWLIGVYVDGWNVVPEPDESNNEITKTISIIRAAADLVVDRLDMPWKASPGEVIPITRTIRNAGVLAATFEYEYVISENEIVSTDDPATEIRVGSAFEQRATLTLGPGASSVATDYVQVPFGLSPGEYHFGAVLDPGARVVEDSDANNAFLAPGPITIVASLIHIDTRALPVGVVAAPYTYQLVANGGTGPYLWDLAAGMLPPGIALGSEGLFSGTARAPGVFSMLVHAQWNGDHAYTWLTLRVTAATGPLAVITTELPTGHVGAAYAAQLVASGGLDPYRWALEGAATLPSGLALDGSGRVQGAPGEAGRFAFDVRVFDAAGTSAVGSVALRVLDGAGMAIAGVRVGAELQPYLPVGQVAVAYSVRFETENEDGAVTWTLRSGVLPAGVRLTGAALVGIPVESGAFQILIEARDSAGSRDSGSFALVVTPRAARFEPVTLSPVRQGERFEFDLAPHADEGSTFSLYSGVLPDGVALSPEGMLSGDVATDARVGSHDFIVRVKAPHGETVLVPLTIRVDAIPKPMPTRSDYGCSSAGVGPAGLGVLALLGLPMLRRRRGPNA